ALPNLPSKRSAPHYAPLDPDTTRDPHPSQLRDESESKACSRYDSLVANEPIQESRNRPPSKARNPRFPSLQVLPLHDESELNRRTHCGRKAPSPAPPDPRTPPPANPAAKPPAKN